MRKPLCSGKKLGSCWMRSLDRWIGIPLIAGLGALRARRSLPQSIRRISLIKGDGMGDLVLLTGLLEDLRHAYPGVEITFWGGGSVLPLARELSVVDHARAMDFRKPVSAIRALRRTEPDVVINCGQWSRVEALIAGLAKAKFVIGFSTPGQHQHYLCDATVPHRNDCHEMENFRALLKPLGIEPGAEPTIALKKVPTACSDDFSKIPAVAFHMFPSGLTHVHLKEWPEKSWAALAGACQREGRRVVITGGRQDRERAQNWIERHQLEDYVENHAGISIAETCALLQQVEAVVSVNTGVMHLAAALGTPTVGLHGPTNPLRWGPVGPKVASLGIPAPEGSYLNLGFEYPLNANQREGIETISIHQVTKQLAELTGVPFRAPAPHFEFAEPASVKPVYTLQSVASASM